jgi:hypothetical protein
VQSGFSISVFEIRYSIFCGSWFERSSSMADGTEANSFGQILEAVDRLSLEDQEQLIDILSHRTADRRRSFLSREIRNARKEFKDGLAKPANPDDILSEILS